MISGNGSLKRGMIILFGVCALPVMASMNVLIEAQSAIKTTPAMRVVDTSDKENLPPVVIEGASGGAYLEIPHGAGKPPEVGGEAVYTFTIEQPGTYHFWARAWWFDGCSNSVGVSINGAPDFVLGQDATYKQWHWVRARGRLAQLDLKAGEHTLKLSNREDGIAIDQILLTRNRRYVPVGIEK